MTHPMYQLRQTFLKDARAFADQVKRQEIVANELKKHSMDPPKGVSERALDIIPGLVICINGIILGIGNDLAPESVVWGYIEVAFTIFFRMSFSCIYGSVPDSVVHLLY